MKDKLLAIENILLCIIFIFLIFQGSFHTIPLFPLSEFLRGHSFDGVILVFAMLNIFLITQFLFVKKKKKFPFISYAILTHLIIFWFLLLFLGSFIASNLLLPFISGALAIIFFFILKKASVKISVLNLVVVLLIFLFTLLFSFEEDYCWNQGTKADPYNIMVIATQKDVEALKGSLSGIKPGDSVGQSWRVHSLCHTTFHLVDGLKDVYLSPFAIRQSVNTQKPRDRIMLYSPAQGEALASIAKKFTISEDTIRWENNLTSNSLKSGDNLRILPVSGVSHIVIQGDTVESLATQHRTSVQKILDYPWNEYTDEQTHTLILGDIMIIPDGIKQ